jgi:serine/threonine-protein kinase
MAGHPEAIGKYRVTRALGKGAMGMVYEGFDPVIERRVAIKTILPELLDAAEMQEAVARFKREAQAGGRLHHPGIVGVYEYGNDGDMAFIVMEFVEGEELKRVLAQGTRYELIDIFEIMKQLLAALDYSHKQGVVHRDIKPANLMIMPGPRLKVMDFGIARLESSNLTQVGTVVGTPTHMAPEQLMGLPADGRTDLWACGVILYELLTGTSPFLAETPGAVMHKVLQGEISSPSSQVASVPAGFDQIIARALARPPEERFQTAREFQAAMLTALQGKPLAAPSARRTATPAARAPALTLSPEALARIEGSLSRHIGPLARILVKRGQAEATTVEHFVRILAEHIEDEAEKADFMKKAAFLKASGAASAAGSVDATQLQSKVDTRSLASAAAAFSPETLAAAERALASYVGPLARILIKDAAGKTDNLKALYAELAAHIDSDDERRTFLASLPR